MNRHFFKQRAKAVQALADEPCQWDGCGVRSNYYTYQGSKTNLIPLCDLHAGVAGKAGYDVRQIPQRPYKPVHLHPDDER